MSAGSWLSAAVRDRLAQLTSRGVRLLLITGETGAGKSAAARYAHDQAGRAGAFLSIAAASLSPDTARGELFGRQAGAYPGAMATQGVVERASSGTLVIEEIGDLALEVQALIRALTDGGALPVGGTEPLSPDVLLIFTSTARLSTLASERRLRPDLAARLSDVEVVLPPLRARRSELPGLAAAALGPGALSSAALERLAALPLLGNLRELRRVLDDAAAAAGDGPIFAEHLPEPPSTVAAPVSLTLAEAVRKHVEYVFRLSGGNVTRTAHVLGISRMAVRRKLREL